MDDSQESEHEFSSKQSRHKSRATKAQSSTRGHSLGKIENHSQTKGVGLALLGSAVKTGNTLLVHNAGANGFDAFEVILARSIFQVGLFGYLMRGAKAPFYPPKGSRLLCISIVVLNTLNVLFGYQAYNMVMPGLAISANRASRTVFTMIMTCLCTTDNLVLVDYLSAAFCTAGMGMIFAFALVAPSEHFVPSFFISSLNDNPVMMNVIGNVLLLLAAFSKSLSMILVRRNKEKFHAFALVFYQAVCSLPVMTVLVLTVSAKEWPPSWPGIGFTAAICITSSVVTWSSNRVSEGVGNLERPELVSESNILPPTPQPRSVQLAPAAIVALVQNIDIVLGFVIDIVFFTHEWPGTLKTVGICLIFIGVLSVAFAKLYRHKKHAPIDD